MHVYIFFYTLTENFYNPQAGIFFPSELCRVSEYFFFHILSLEKEKYCEEKHDCKMHAYYNALAQKKNQSALDWRPSQFADKTQILTIVMVMQIERNACMCIHVARVICLKVSYIISCM